MRVTKLLKIHQMAYTVKLLKHILQKKFYILSLKSYNIFRKLSDFEFTLTKLHLLTKFKEHYEGSTLFFKKMTKKR